MSDERLNEVGDLEIFGKIDALLGKRAGFTASAGPGPVEEDFPVLTEVVAPSSAEKGHHLAVDALRSDAFASQQSVAKAVLEAEATDRIIAVVESRLSDLFSRQQRDLEDMVRRLVREELARLRSQSPRD